MMPRTARKISKTGIYHLTLRGINLQNIFEEDEDCFIVLLLKRFFVFHNGGLMRNEDNHHQWNRAKRLHIRYEGIVFIGNGQKP